MVRNNFLLMSLSCVAIALKPPFLRRHSHTSSDYSDWTADAGINLQPSTPLSSRKRARRPLSSSEEEEDAAAEDEEEKRQSDEESSGVKKSKQKARKPKSKAPRVGSLRSSVGGMQSSFVFFTILLSQYHGCRCK